MEAFFFDQQFNKDSFIDQKLQPGEYENCVFSHCALSKADLGKSKFTDCRFVDCDLSMARLTGTSFSDCAFVDCRMFGLLFYNCHPFGLGFRFERCQLNHSSFFKTKIRAMIFQECSLEEVDFTDADLTGATLSACNLKNAMFENTILEKADFRGAYNFSIDPDLNRMRRARFSRTELNGLLDKHDLDIE